MKHADHARAAEVLLESPSWSSYQSQMREAVQVHATLAVYGALTELIEVLTPPMRYMGGLDGLPKGFIMPCATGANGGPLPPEEGTPEAMAAEITRERKGRRQP